MAIGFFNPQKGETPASVEQYRKLAEALMRGGSPRNIGEGISSIGDGIVANVLGRRADKAEAAGMESWQGDWGPIMAALGGGREFPEAPSMPSAGGASVSLPVEAATIRQGLIERGLPEHVADGFVLNFKDESNLNPGINEASPIVPGSRGGFGLSQWTGPRRKALEAFAAERGAPIDDTNLQLDFLMTELQGPEKDAFDKIMAAQDPGSAAAAIVNNFLRPAEQHRARREARYLSSGAPQYAEAAPVQVASADPQAIPMPTAPDTMQQGQPVASSPVGNRILQTLLSPQPMAEQVGPMTMGGVPESQQPIQLPQQTAQAAPDLSQISPMAGGTAGTQQGMQRQGPSLEQLLGAAQNTFAPQAAQGVLKLLIEQELQKNDPMRRLQLEKGQIEIEQMRNPREELPDSVRALDERAQRAGLQPGTPEYADFMISGGSKGISVDARNMGGIPPGFRVEYDEAGNPVQMVPIPGGPAAAEAQAAEAAADAKGAQQQRYGTVVVEDIDRAVKQIEESPWFTTGLLGQWSQGIAGTPAHRVSKLLDTVKANAGFDRLQAMRDSSPTGGALGQVSNIELGLLQSAIGSLEQSNDAEDLTYNLRRVQDIYNQIIHGPDGAPQQDGEGGPGLDELLEMYGD